MKPELLAAFKTAQWILIFAAGAFLLAIFPQLVLGIVAVIALVGIVYVIYTNTLTDIKTQRWLEAEEKRLRYINDKRTAEQVKMLTEYEAKFKRDPDRNSDVT